MESGNFRFVSIIFIMMAIFPFLILSKQGRSNIGIIRPKSYKWLVISFLLGMIACLIVFLIGYIFYSKTNSNWFVYIGNTYPIDFSAISNDDKLIYFIIFSIIGMTFSPLGEELMYRGFIHESMVDSLGENKSSLIDSTAFGVTHLAHFGIVFLSGKWQFLLVPATLWVLLIFCSGMLFNHCKKMSGSILGAIICHSGFNLAMTYLIFYHLFR